MGRNLYCVLQKKNKKTKKFETVLEDVFDIRNSTFFNFLKNDFAWGTEYDDIAHDGFPDDFKFTEKTEDGETFRYHKDYYIGSYSFGHLTLKEFTDAYIPKYDDPKFEIEQHSDGYTVRFKEPEEYDDYALIREIQTGLKFMFDTSSEGTEYGETYRLVFGFS